MREGSNTKMQEKLEKCIESQYFHFTKIFHNFKCFISRFELNYHLVSECKIKIEYKKHTFELNFKCMYLCIKCMCLFKR